MDKRDRFDIRPFQSFTPEELSRLGLERGECRTALKLVDESGRIHSGAFAVNYFLLRHQPWTLLALIISIIPVFLLAEIVVYWLVSRNRHTISRWLGLSSCKATNN